MINVQSRADRLIKLERACVADFHDDRAFARIVLPIKDHFAGNAVKLFRIRQLLSNGVAVLLQIARQAAGVLNRLQQQIDGIPRQRADIIGNVAVFGIVFVNKFFGFAMRSNSSSDQTSF